MRFVVRARLELRQQTERHQLQTGEDQQDAEQQQRAVGNRLLARQPHVGEPPGNARPEQTHREANEAEDLQRARRVTQQKLDRQQIQDDAHRPAEAVFRSSVPPRAVVDHDLGDGDALLAGNRRQEPVHLTVELQRLDDFGAEHFERAAIIVQVHAGGRRDQPVRNRRGQSPRQECVLPILPPAADNVGATFERVHHCGNVARIVLEVAVGSDDQPAPRVSETGGERGGLPEVAPETDDPQVRIDGLQPRESLEAPVGAPVVDDDDFVRSSPRGKRLVQFAMELRQRGRFIVNWDDDAELWVHYTVRL